MGKIEYHLDRIATALELIAKRMETAIPEETNLELNGNFDIPDESNFITHSPQLPDEELFIKTTNIYLDETKRKNEEGLQRKSAIKLSQNLIPMQLSFLKNHLPPSFTANENSNAVLVVNHDETPKALIRFYTDLGFHRADHWRKDILNICKTATKLTVSHDNIFLIVMSNLNGLDNNHVCSTLGTKISNKDLLDPSNLDILKEYNNLYIQSFSDILPCPSNQIYFLTGALHPNVVATNLFSNPNIEIDLEKHPWLSTPLSDIFNRINII
jgi:hypothetical protein